MRSWTIFVIFGILLVALLVFSQISKNSTSTHPAVQAAQYFFVAVKNNHAAEAKKFLDTTNATIDASGDSIVSLHFNETIPYKAAFSRQPAATWKYVDLIDMQVDLDAKPTEDEADGMANVKLLNGYMVMLKKGDTGWKVFYILRPKKGH